MINVHTKINRENIPYEFTVSGHAMFDESGKDIVCAAVSMLVINTFNAMKIYTEDEKELRVDEGMGMIIIKLPTIEKNAGTKELEVLAKALLLGLDSVEKEYGDKYIKVKEV